MRWIASSSSLKVNLEVEAATTLAVFAANRRHDVDLVGVGASGIQARTDGVGGIVLRRENNDAARVAPDRYCPARTRRS